VELKVNSESDLGDVAARLIAFAGETKVFLFRGAMGSGKTTFIKAICRFLGSTDSFSSPTYAIVNQYESERGRLFHFDLYRLKNAGELLDIGIEEYLFSGNYCFFEWPDLVEQFVEGAFVEVDIQTEANIRYIRASKRGT
jgi:tRNA threonylcarbamoyladenosine biosynthesis protein TsaE